MGTGIWAGDGSAMGVALGVLPVVFCGTVAAAAFVLYLKRQTLAGRYARRMRVLAIAAAGFHLLYAPTLAVVQYLVWRGSEVTRGFTESSLGVDVPAIFPLNVFPWIGESSLGYFLFYSWGRFWFEAVLTVAAALAFWALLKVLRARSDRFFENGDVTLGFAMALLSPWPGFLIFLGFTFVAVVLVSIYRMVVLREPYTTLGAPFLLAAFLTLMFRSMLIRTLGLS